MLNKKKILPVSEVEMPRLNDNPKETADINENKPINIVEVSSDQSQLLSKTKILVSSSEQVETLNKLGIICSIGDYYLHEEAKERWQTLAKKYHPDKGGSDDLFKQHLEVKKLLDRFKFKVAAKATPISSNSLFDQLMDQNKQLYEQAFYACEKAINSFYDKINITIEILSKNLESSLEEIIKVCNNAIISYRNNCNRKILNQELTSSQLETYNDWTNHREQQLFNYTSSEIKLCDCTYGFIGQMNIISSTVENMLGGFSQQLYHQQQIHKQEMHKLVATGSQQMQESKEKMQQNRFHMKKVGEELSCYVQEEITNQIKSFNKVTEKPIQLQNPDANANADAEAQLFQLKMNEEFESLKLKMEKMKTELENFKNETDRVNCQKLTR